MRIISKANICHITVYLSVKIWFFYSFVRRGKAGGYKDELPADIIYDLDLMIQRNLDYYGLSLNELLLLDDNAALWKTFLYNIYLI